MSQNTDGKLYFTSEEFDKIAAYLVFKKDTKRDNIIIPRLLGQASLKTNEEKMVEAAFESCTFKSLMSCVIGEQSFILHF